MNIETSLLSGSSRCYIIIILFKLRLKHNNQIISINFVQQTNKTFALYKIKFVNGITQKFAP